MVGEKTNSTVDFKTISFVCEIVRENLISVPLVKKVRAASEQQRHISYGDVLTNSGTF